jgi:hypothetical protein
MQSSHQGRLACVLYVSSTVFMCLQFDRSGKLGFDEFKKLWADIRQWKVGAVH